VTGPPFEAAVFDLFGTLVPEYTRTAFYDAVTSTASVIGVDPIAFREGWDRTAPDRQMGEFPDIASNVRSICEGLGVLVDDDTMARALAEREELRGRGYPIALVSMCAPDIPARWRALPLAPLVDVAIFSTEVGLRKPDPAIYLAATNGLGVAPGRCLYCGDGAYGELSGAAAVGMAPFLIRDPSLDHDALLTPERDDGWDGPVIGDLRELLPLLPPLR
jgi:putative hydrolase of the HAD superfamily